MSTQAETCRAHAEKCRADAKLAKGERSRNNFFDLARHWESMAYDIEGLEALRQRLLVTDRCAALSRKTIAGE
jgi:hypothetical protein